MDDLAIGRSVRAVRVRRGWRQADVAEAAGVSRATVSRIELGQLETIQLGTMRQVCRALGIRLTLEARGQGGDLDRLLGARHSAMHEGLARLFADLPDWVAVPEVTFAIFGERGAIDVLAWHADDAQPARDRAEDRARRHPGDRRDAGPQGAPRRADRRGARLGAGDGVGLARRRRGTDQPASRWPRTPRCCGPRIAPTGGRSPRWLRAPTGRVAALSFLSDARPGSVPAGFSAVTRVATRRGAGSGGLAVARRSRGDHWIDSRGFDKIERSRAWSSERRSAVRRPRGERLSSPARTDGERAHGEGV